MTQIRGIEAKHEHAAQQLARDTRPIGVRVSEFVCNPTTILAISISSVVGSFMYQMLTDLYFVSTGLLFWFAATRKNKLPFRLPRSAHTPDFNDLIPGTRTPKNSGGISFLGNDRATQEELWFTNDDLRTHILIFGSTGSGKTESLVSIAFNSLIHGSGFIYIDGKGDNSLFAKIFSMVRTMGRDDDMLLVNFMTGARDVIGPQERRLSNTMNPFASGSSSMVSNLVTSLMDSSGEGGNADMWKGRAINFVESLMKILCYMRDDGHILLDANTIRDYFILEKLESIVVDKKFPIGNFKPKIDISHVPAVVMEPLTNYVLNLPGYNPRKKGDQGSEVREQHGFITMQLTRVFGSLADTYGHILRTNLAEVDLKDVVLNRRILVVLLPALEKSPDELSNLGKVIIASLKAMMAAGLGDAVEGDYRDVILRKPTNSPSPYVCIMDEYGYYAVKGFAVVPAQARSLGFSAVFAGQDLPAFQKASKEEAASIGANCNIKICMKLEDPQETWEFFNKVAGESYVTNVSGFQQSAGSISLNYMDTKNASVDKRQRIDLLDLKDQREGECHIFFKSAIIRAEMFFANPKPVKQLRIGHFLKVENPSLDKLIALHERLESFSKQLKNQNYPEPEVQENDDLLFLQSSFVQKNKSIDDTAILTLVGMIENHLHNQNQKDIDNSYDKKGSYCAFSSIPTTNPLIEVMIGADNLPLFAVPLVRCGVLNDGIETIERLLGNDSIYSINIAQAIMTQLQQHSSYPPAILFNADSDQYWQDLNTLLTAMGGRPVDKQSFLNEFELPLPGVGEYISAEQALQQNLTQGGLLDLPDLSELEDLLGG